MIDAAVPLLGKPSTSGITQSATPEPQAKPEREPMFVTLGGKWYKLVEEPSSADDILAVPKSKQLRMGGARM